MLVARRLAIYALAVSVTMTGSPSWAQWCSEPSKPSCLLFGEPDSFCETSVRRYLDSERDFRQCVIDEANRKIDEAKRQREESIERANRVVRQWNCYASGEKYCL